MANRYFPSFFGRGEDPFRSLFQEVQKTFEDFSRRTPFARFGSDMLSPRIDVAESKDAIEVTAELPGVDEKDVDVTLEDDVLTIHGEKIAVERRGVGVVIATDVSGSDHGRDRKPGSPGEPARKVQ